VEPADLGRRDREDLRRVAVVRGEGEVVPPAELETAVVEAATALLAEVEGTVGVITPVPRRDEVVGWLGGLAAPRLQVVTSLEAKGMEYDGVVLVAPGEIRADPGSGVRTLYVALSRATQRLTTVDPVG
jgi:superfamily I DNA/RNA helicase